MISRIYNFAGFCSLVFFPLYLFSAHAADVDKAPISDGQRELIFISGDLVFGDEKKFANVAANSRNAIVVFQSRGGNLLAGIEIGTAIRLRSFSTLVPDRVQCSSACALAWLGGRTRYMSETAHVGFHAAYMNAEGQAAISSAGNALVGAYLNQLGLPATAIIYITDAPPDGMEWLNFSKARQYGIEVQPFNLAARPAASLGTSSSQLFSLQVSSVRKEFFQFVGATNSPNDLSLSYLERKYLDRVNYYGKFLPKESVLNDKRAFFYKMADQKLFNTSVFGCYYV